MSTASLTAPTTLLQQAWFGLLAAVDAIRSAKHNKQQIEPVQRLLKASNACESTNPDRSEALREQAAALIH